MGLFQAARKAPPAVATDTVIPMSVWDDNSVYRSVLLYITLRFDHVLDPEKLRMALERLIELGGWRKLGARVRMTDNGKLEYHVPKSFNSQRPAFGYSLVKHEICIQDHPVASRMPRATGIPAVYSDLGELRDLAHRIDGPKYLEDFLYSDEPQLSLHIISFQDATLVSLSWMHTLMDASAMSALLNAWILVLNGQESKVPSVCNFDEDPLFTLGIAPTEQYTLRSRLLGGLNKAHFTLRYIFDLIFYQDSQRTIYIPAHKLSAMKKIALQDLSELSSKDPKKDLEGNNPPFVSDGDILCAYLTKIAVRNEGASSSRQITIMNALNLRQSLSASLLPPSAGIYLSNAVFTIAAFGTACDIIGKPLSYTASLIRTSILEQSSAAQVEALAALTRQAVEQTGWPPVFGEGGMRMVIFTNWTKAGFLKLDFGAAVMGGEWQAGEDSVVPVTPSFVNSTGVSNGLSPRGAWTILGVDNSGGYWVQGNLRSDLWSGVENDLMEMRS